MGSALTIGPVGKAAFICESTNGKEDLVKLISEYRNDVSSSGNCTHLDGVTVVKDEMKCYFNACYFMDTTVYATGSSSLYSETILLYIWFMLNNFHR